MAQDEILIKYRVDDSEFSKVYAATADISSETKKLQAQIKATYSDKSIEEATKALYEQGDVMGALINKYGNATTALKAMEKELATMSALGQRGTKQFEELANATAQLKDNIGDTRNEIKKMASDTKVFDTMVQGARGVAAAFSVATGLTAALGSENKDLEKAILKVQGAMAALQGVQELANIATEKGGIATKAYGVALQVVDKISKVTGLSMAASWALATGGITILIAGVTSLIYLLQKADDTAKENAEKENERQSLLQKTIARNQEKSYKEVMQMTEEFDRQQERRRKEAILANKDSNLVELQLLNEKIAQTKSALENASLITSFFNEEDKIKYRKFLEDRLLDAEVAAKKIRDAITRDHNLQPTDNISPITSVGPLVTQGDVDMNKRNVDQMNKDLKEFGYNKAIKAQEEYEAAKQRLTQETISNIQNMNTSLFEFVGMLYENELSESNANKEQELKNAGDNADAKKRIEQKYAIEQAKIRRQQAIVEKTSALFNIGATLAQTIMKIQSEAAVLASNPATAALSGMAYAQIGLTIAGAAIQAATIAAKPLPEIPKFEKGGSVIAGGRNNDGYLIGRSHRDGGILINAQGGEYIWDIPTVKRHGEIIKAAHENRLDEFMFHKYVAPIIKNEPQRSSDVYDDALLRKTIRDTSERSAKQIAKGVTESIKDTAYIQNRYR